MTARLFRGRVVIVTGGGTGISRAIAADLLSLVKNEWEVLDCSRNGPEELEEHSMVAYKGTLYIFGGMVDSAFTQAETPLWIYDIALLKTRHNVATAVMEQEKNPSVIK